MLAAAVCFTTLTASAAIAQTIRMAQTLRTEPSQTTKRQAQHRHATQSRRMEP